MLAVTAVDDDYGNESSADSVAGAHAAFRRLTDKQHQVLCLVAENRTSKEIAWELGISESAVNQRIEGVRGRTGGASRAELARSYRQYRIECAQSGEDGPGPPCKPIPDKIPQVYARSPATQTVPRNDPEDGEGAGRFALADAVTFTFAPPWMGEQVDRIVPEVLDGAHAGLSRTAAMIAIAVGILVVAIVGLGVVQALSDII